MPHLCKLISTTISHYSCNNLLLFSIVGNIKHHLKLWGDIHDDIKKKSSCSCSCSVVVLSFLCSCTALFLSVNQEFNFLVCGEIPKKCNSCKLQFQFQQSCLCNIKNPWLSSSILYIILLNLKCLIQIGNYV